MAGKAADAKQINIERRKRVMLGPLPPNFLKITTSPRQQQEAADQQAAMALYHDYVVPVPQNPVGRLNITIAQARLEKNYGLTRWTLMDPYVRLRVGHCVYETQTVPNGGKNPHWNKEIQCLLPQGVNSIYLEIFDERSFTMDERIAWAHIPIPVNVLMSGETCEDWYLLNGKLGDGKEGKINLVLSYSSGSPFMYGNTTVAAPPVMMVPTTGQGIFGVSQFEPVSVYTQVPQNMAVVAEKNISQIEEMFPNIDKEVIKTVFKANNGDKDATVNSLLQMSEA